MIVYTHHIYYKNRIFYLNTCIFLYVQLFISLVRVFVYEDICRIKARQSYFILVLLHLNRAYVTNCIGTCMYIPMYRHIVMLELFVALDNKLSVLHYKLKCL